MKEILDPIIQSPPLLYAGVFVFSLLVGSFLNVVILRLPKRMLHDWRCQCRELLEIEQTEDSKPPSLVMTRSQCPHCGYGIKAWQNIPLLSYLLLGGKCAGCKARISLRYPFVELLTAILSVAVIWYLGPTYQGLAGLFITWTLIALSGIDIDHKLLFDDITLPLMWAGLLVSLIPVFVDPINSIIGAATGYLVLWSFFHLFKLATGKEGMGYGDFKLMAALGAWFGWQAVLLIIVLSTLLGAVFGILIMLIRRQDKNNPIPFGPYIAAAGWVAMLWSDKLIAFYQNISGY